MTPYYWFHMWTTGTYEVKVRIPLDSNKRYLVTGYLTLTDGDDYAHVYISQVCHLFGDHVLCGIRDFEDDADLNIVEFIDNAINLDIKLKTKGGRHRAEGMVYEL